jgi:exodeoxyribonuclease VII large subunit
LRTRRRWLNSLARDIPTSAPAQARKWHRELDRLRQEIATVFSKAVTYEIDYLRQKVDLVDAHDPCQVLRRGFSITRNSSGNVIKSDSQVAPGETVLTALAQGQITSVITQKSNNADGGRS